MLESTIRKVDVVLTDVMMPRMGGAELSKRIADLYPNLPVLLMSGYADVDVHGESDFDRSRQFLEKPFTASALLNFVRNARAGVAAA